MLFFLVWFGFLIYVAFIHGFLLHNTTGQMFFPSTLLFVCTFYSSATLRVVNFHACYVCLFSIPKPSFSYRYFSMMMTVDLCAAYSFSTFICFVVFFCIQSVVLWCFYLIFRFIFNSPYEFPHYSHSIRGHAYKTYAGLTWFEQSFVITAALAIFFGMHLF